MTDRPTCTWTEDEDGLWWAACEGNKRTWEFNSAGPLENSMRFCPFCGRKLVPVPLPVEEG